MPPQTLSAPPLTAEPPGRAAGWSLRLQINLLVAGLTGLFVALLIALQIEGTRSSVREEIVAANRVATQLLQRVSWIYTSAGPRALQEFLERLGRVRANDITLEDAAGQLLFRSPPATYKQGRSAPPWYVALVAPPLQRQVITLPGGRLTVEADPSRAILDGWDDLRQLALMGAAALALLHLGLFWLVGRALRPWPTLVAGLARLRSGDYHARLPALGGQEAGLIGREVNRLAAAIEAQLDARMRAFEAERRLAESRELARRLEAHAEAERRAIARTLHDEFAQGITGIRSLARGLQNRLEPHDAASARAAALICDEAARLYDAMHGLIPRLAPPALDELGLVDALQGLVDRSRASHPGVALAWQGPGDPTDSADPAAGLGRLGAEATRALYAVAQEGLTNALRHSGAGRVELSLDVVPPDTTTLPERPAGGPGSVRLRLADDGCGLPPDWAQRQRHGLRGLRERLAALGGKLVIEPGIGGRGTALQASLAAPPVAPPAEAP